MKSIFELHNELMEECKHEGAVTLNEGYSEKHQACPHCFRMVITKRNGDVRMETLDRHYVRAFMEGKPLV